MSMYLTVDEATPTEIASNTGWGDFSRWVEALEDAPELQHLVDHGWTEPAADAREELQDAIESHPPGPDVLTIAQSILDLLDESSGVIVVGNGIGEGEDEPSVPQDGLEPPKSKK